MIRYVKCSCLHSVVKNRKALWASVSEGFEGSGRIVCFNGHYRCLESVRPVPEI